MFSENKLDYDSSKLVEVKKLKKEIDFNKLNFEYEVKFENNELSYTKKINDKIEKQKQFHQDLENAQSLDEVKAALKIYTSE